MARIRIPEPALDDGAEPFRDETDDRIGVLSSLAWDLPEEANAKDENGEHEEVAGDSWGVDGKSPEANQADAAPASLPRFFKF